MRLGVLAWAWSVAAASQPVPADDGLALALGDFTPEQLGGMSAALTVALAVTEAGTVGGCTVTISSGSPAADARACALLTERAHFSPVAGTYPYRLPFFPRVKAVPAAPETWVTAADYPTVALTEGKEGAVTAALFVDAEGRVSDCAILKSAGDAALDAVTCTLVRARGRFEPARTSAGVAVASATTHSVMWRIPRTEIETKP